MAQNLVQQPLIISNEASATVLSDLELREIIVSAWVMAKKAAESNNKEVIRKFHQDSKVFSWTTDAGKLLKYYEKHKELFICGKKLNPNKIQPELILVEGRGKWSEIFKLCKVFWSIPFSKGYGRRLRYVVYDSHHNAVIGIIGLQSPPADLKCRDSLFSYPDSRKLQLINCTMDAFTVGAVQPYASLLGGKLIASLLSSVRIRQDYWKKYAAKRTEMQNNILPQPLLAITTTSAYGRSSIYNRLKYFDKKIAYSIGYTEGYGTVHLESIYSKIVDWLKHNNLYKEGGYGSGPKVRWQNIAIALNALGLKERYLNHGIKREVFLIPHVSNLADVMSGTSGPLSLNYEHNLLSEFWKERWCLKRIQTDDRWRTTNPKLSLLQQIKKIQSTQI